MSTLEAVVEELKHLYADCTGTVHPRILRLTSTPMPMGEVRAGIAKLEAVLHTASPEQLRARIATLLPEYTPWVQQRGEASCAPRLPEEKDGSRITVNGS